MHRTLLLAAAVAVGGCPSSPARIDVEPATPRLSNQLTQQQLRAVVRDAEGNVLPAASVSFTTLTPLVVAVDEQGLIQAVHSGNGTVLVKAGKLNKEVGVIVQLAAEIAIDPDSPRLMLGVTRGFKATVLNDRKQPMFAVGEVRWASSDPTVLSVDQNGVVKTHKEGEATLSAHAAGITGSTVVVVRHERLHDDGTLE